MPSDQMLGLVVVWGVLHGLTHHHLGGHPEPTRGQQALRPWPPQAPPGGQGQGPAQALPGPDVRSFHPLSSSDGFLTKDAFQAASQPSPAAAPTPTRRGQQQSRATGSWGRGGWGQGAEGPGRSGAGISRERAGEKRRGGVKGERERG